MPCCLMFVKHDEKYIKGKFIVNVRLPVTKYYTLYNEISLSWKVTFPTPMYS
jgi:hypothetical protein